MNADTLAAWLEQYAIGALPPDAAMLRAAAAALAEREGETPDAIFRRLMVEEAESVVNYYSSTVKVARHPAMSPQVAKDILRLHRNVDEMATLRTPEPAEREPHPGVREYEEFMQSVQHTHPVIPMPRATPQPSAPSAERGTTEWERIAEILSDFATTIEGEALPGEVATFTDRILAERGANDGAAG